MNQEILEKFKKLNLLIAGQVLTSRTETIEEHYRNKVSYLGVVGLVNPYSVRGLARCTLYDNGKRVREFPLFNVHLKGIYWFNQLLMGPVFSLYAISMFISVLRLRRRFDLFIGIACFSTLFGIILKKLGIVKNVIYYTLDYYPKPAKLHVNTFINKTIWHLDKYCCKKSLLVWNISPRIPEAREKLMNFNRILYRYMHVPLTYGKNLLRFCQLKEIDQNTIVFVGSLSWNQGLQLVIKSIPDLLKLKPELKVRIIGKGVNGNDIKRMVNEYGLNDRFIFHGFVQKEKDVVDIISRCAIGICTWTDESDNNVIYADPGKPKLYAFCGIPIIITNATAVAEEINSMCAGISINYDKQQFMDAVLKILQNRKILEMYRNNAKAFAEKYTTEDIFQTVDREILYCLGNNREN